MAITREIRSSKIIFEYTHFPFSWLVFATTNRLIFKTIDLVSTYSFGLNL